MIGLLLAIALGQTPATAINRPPAPTPVPVAPAITPAAISIPGPAGPIGPAGPKGDTGPKGDPGTNGTNGLNGTTTVTPVRGIDASLPPYNLGTSGNDDEAALRLLIAGLPASSAPTILLPAQLGFARPCLIQRDDVRLKGLGSGQTNIYVYGGYDAFVVGQVGSTTPDGAFTYDDASRPDLFGLLDVSVAPTPGVAWGFDTKGRSFALDKGNGLQNGAYDRSVGAWDYWGSATGLTIEFAILGTPPPGVPLLGCGDYSKNPAPYMLCTGQTPNTVSLLFRLAGDPIGTFRTLTIGGFDFSGARQINRGRLWLDPPAGTSGGWANGIDQTPVGRTPTDLIIAGGSFAPNDHDQPFAIGSLVAPAATPYVVAGLCVSNVAVKTDAGNDALRYLKTGPGVVGGFDITTKPPGRLLKMFGGQSANFAAGALGPTPPPGGYAVVFDGVCPIPRSPGRFRLEGVSINGGGVTLAGATEAQLTDVAATGGRTGFDCAHNFANWRVTTTGCRFGGDVAAVKFYNSVAIMNQPLLTSGGLATVIDTSSGVVWNQPMVSGFGPRQSWAFMMLSGAYGGQRTFRDLIVDGEYQALGSGGFLLENTYGTLCSLTIANGAIGGIAPGGVNIAFVGGPAGATPARIDVTGYGFAPCQGSLVVGGAAGELYGNVDFRQNPFLADPSGPGYDPTQLKIQR